MAHILVIDDEELVRYSLKSLLEEDGHEVTVAADGVEGIQKLRANGFDLVITDIVMPRKEGIETIGEIKTSYPGLKVIAISGGSRIGTKNMAERAVSVGADLVLAKPFSNDVLFESIDHLLGLGVRNGQAD